MKIGGFVKQSLIDYPGKVAAIVFTQGCNFRCGYCHNPQLVLPELFYQSPSIPVDEVLAYLQERKKWLDGVVITGGEPTIHKDLPAFLKKIKDMGYQVKLDTNGSDPYMLEQIIKEKLVDSIAMDIKILPEDNMYAQIIGIDDVSDVTEKIIVSIIMLKSISIDVEFRTTNIPGVHNKVMLELIQQLVGKDKRYKVNDFRDGQIISSYN